MFFHNNRFMREGTSEGNPGPNLSLAELEALSVNDPKDLQVVAAEQEAAAKAAEEAAKLEVAKPDPAKTTDVPDPTKVIEPVLTAEQQATADAAKAAEEAAKVTDTPKDPEEDYYAVVDKITGREYEIEYPENIEPTTPEGTAYRENFIREASFAEYEEMLREKNPKGFAYLLHTQNGGSDEEFFGDKKGFVLPAQDQVAASVEVQTMVYKQDLISMGLDADAAQTLVEKAVKENKLLERANASYTKIDTAQRQYLADIDAKNKENHARTTAMVANVTTQLENTINDMNMIVPDSMKPAFKQFMIDNLQMTPDGKFMFVQEINPKELKVQAGALFYQFIKGDLGKIVEKKVRTEAAHRLSLKADKTKTNTNKDAAIVSTTNKTLTLGEL